MNANVSFFNSSTQALDQLKIAQESIVEYEEQVKRTGPLKPLTDVCTRWWATFDMIHRMFYLRTALNVLVASDVLPKRLEISVAQWEALAGIRDVLKPISIVQKLLEGEKYVTASWLPILIHTCRKGLEKGCNHQSATVRIMSKVLKDDYEVRWGKENDQWYNPNTERGAGNRET